MSTRWLQTIRTAVSLLVVAWLNMAFHFDDPFWGTVTIFFLSLPYAESTLTRSIWWVIATVLGGYVGLAYFSLTANHNLVSLVGIFLLTLLGGYKALTAKYPIAWVFGVGNFYYIGLTVISLPDTAWSTMVWRDVQVVMSITVLLFFSFIFLGRRATSVAPMLFAKLAHSEADLYRGLIDAVVHNWDKDALLPRVRIMRDSLRKVDQAVDLVLNTRHFKGFRSVVVVEALLRHRDIVAQLEHLEITCRTGVTPKADEIAKLELRALVEAVAPLLEQANPLREGAPVSISAAELQVRASEAAFEEIRADHRALAEGLISHALIGCSKIILDLVQQIYLLQQMRPTVVLGEQKAGLEPKPWSSRLVATTPRIAFRRAVGIGITAVLALLVILATTWPFARLGVTAAIMVGMEREIHFTWRRAAQRVGGVCIGAVVGLSMLSFFVGDVLSFCFVFFLVCLPPAYLVAGPPGSNVIGVWMGVALAFTMTQSDVLSPVLSLPLQAVAGVLIGSAVGLAVALVARPTPPRRALDNGLGQVFEAMGSLLRCLAKHQLSEEEIHEPKVQLISQHNFNTDLLDSLKDKWRHDVWHFETRAILQVLALTRENRVERAAEILADQIDVIAALRDLATRFADVGHKLRTGECFTVAVENLDDKMTALNAQVVKLRAAGTLLRLPPRQARAPVFVLSALMDLYKVVQELTLHQSEHPRTAKSRSKTKPVVAPA